LSEVPGTDRQDSEGIVLDGAEEVRVVRTFYHRRSDEDGVCPFCGAEADWIDKTGPGGTFRKMRYECECGAHGVDMWTWEAGEEPVEAGR